MKTKEFDLKEIRARMESDCIEAFRKNGVRTLLKARVMTMHEYMRIKNRNPNLRLEKLESIWRKLTGGKL